MSKVNFQRDDRLIARLAADLNLQIMHRGYSNLSSSRYYTLQKMGITYNFSQQKRAAGRSRLALKGV